jgi:hypothetical protein
MNNESDYNTSDYNKTKYNRIEYNENDYDKEEENIRQPDKEENIRQPDKVIKETLLPTLQTDQDIELELALKTSIDEYFGLCKKSEDYETQIIEDYNNEMLNRQKLINPIIFEIERISKYDKSFVELYQLLEPILQLYIQQYLNFYECDLETFNKIFNKLSTIRLNKDKQDILKQIFILVD